MICLFWTICLSSSSSQWARSHAQCITSLRLSSTSNIGHGCPTWKWTGRRLYKLVQTITCQHWSFTTVHIIPVYEPSWIQQVKPFPLIAVDLSDDDVIDEFAVPMYQKHANTEMHNCTIPGIFPSITEVQAFNLWLHLVAQMLLTTSFQHCQQTESST